MQQKYRLGESTLKSCLQLCITVACRQNWDWGEMGLDTCFSRLTFVLTKRASAFPFSYYKPERFSYCWECGKQQRVRMRAWGCRVTVGGGVYLFYWKMCSQTTFKVSTTRLRICIKQACVIYYLWRPILNHAGLVFYCWVTCVPHSRPSANLLVGFVGVVAGVWCPKKRLNYLAFFFFKRELKCAWEQWV